MRETNSASRTPPPRMRRRLAALARRRPIRRLCSIASRLDIPLWIVGGALRDALDGREPSEIDVAAVGCESLARAMESAGAGKAVVLSEASPRVYRIAGETEIDCAEVEGDSIRADLARRDFTVNAMAWNPRDGSWLDPYGGAADLSRRRLRLISEANLRDDPLRALRAARFIATHRLIADRETRRAVRAVAPLLAGAAPERIRVELIKLLAAPRAGPAFEMALSVGLLEPALGISPGGRIGSATVRSLDRDRIRRAAPPDRVRLRLALVAARLRMSPGEAARWLSARRFSRDEAAEIAALLQLADRARRASTPREQWGWVRDSGTRRALALTFLSLCEPRRSSRYRRLARLRPVVRNVRVTGGDILEWLSIEPGPRVGALLREVEIEAMRGAVRSRSAARRWLIENSRGPGVTEGKIGDRGENRPDTPEKRGSNREI
jgi:tRNA nucleotidyltransferase (CCA-adding enzyme)